MIQTLSWYDLPPPPPSWQPQPQRRRLTVDEVQYLGGYAVLYADPPWSYRDSNCMGAAAHHYPTVTLDQLKAMPVPRIASRSAVLFLWSTFPLIREALELIKAWDFEYKSIAFAWVKTYPKAGNPVMGLGRWTRGNVEPCLLATRGKPQLRRQDAGVSQLVFTEEPLDSEQVIIAPRMRHSAKPVEVRDRIVRLMGGDTPRLELFARDRGPGWEVWGAEVDSDIIMPCGNMPAPGVPRSEVIDQLSARYAQYLPEAR